MFFKCMNRGCGRPIANGTMFWKWKDKTRMTQIHVCPDCWKKARSLKVSQWEKEN